MNKLFLCLFLLLSFSSYAKADWDPYVMTKEKFVHLTAEQQREVVIKTMEFFVAMEQAIPKDYEVGVFDSAQNKKVVELFKKLQGFIISSAYAQENSSLVKLANQFNQLISKLGTKACIYAGYVSEINSLPDGTEYCPHPLNVKSSIKKQITDAYLKSGQLPESAKAEACSLQANKVSCNPVVFGYKNGSTPFCVKTSLLKQGEPQNVAYNCMRASLGDGSEERLDLVAKAFSESEKAVSDVHNTLFKMCICGNEGNINPDYQEYMRGHRTCLGLMNTLKNVNGSIVCAEVSDSNKAVTDIIGFADFFTRDTKNFKNQSPVKKLEFDEKYSSVIDSIADLESVRKVCGTEKKPEEPEEPVIPEPDPIEDQLCTATVAASEDDPKNFVVTLKFKEGLEAVPVWPEAITASEDKLSGTITQTAEVQKISIPFKVGDKEYSGEEACSAEIPAPSDDTPADDGKKYTIDAKSQTPETSIVKVIATVTINGETVTPEKMSEEKLTIIWHYKNFPSTATPPVKEKPSTKVGDIKTEEAGEEINKDPKRQDKVGKGPEIPAPRSTAEYDACAELMKDDKVVASDCDKVAPVQTPKAPTQMNQMPPKMMPPAFFNNKRNIGF